MWQDASYSPGSSEIPGTEYDLDFETDSLDEAENRSRKGMSNGKIFLITLTGLTSLVIIGKFISKLFL